MELKRDLEPRQILAGESHDYELRMGASQLLRVVVEQQGADVGVGLYDPHGKPVAEVDSPTGRYGPERLSAVSMEEGTHRLEVRALGEPTPTGTYRLTVEELRPATRDDLRRVEAERIFALGDALFMSGSKDSLGDAVTHYGKALDVWRELTDPGRQADALLRLGWSRRSLRDNEAAESELQEARKAYAEVGDRYGEGLALNSLAAVHLDRREYRDALEWIEQALAIGRELESGFLMAECLNNLGVVHRHLGNADASFDAFSEALGLYEKLGEIHQVAITRSNRALPLIRRGDLGKAADDLNAALEIWNKSGDAPGDAAIALSRLGDVRKLQGRLDEAQASLEQALELRRQVKDPKGEAVTLNSLGTTHLLRKDFDLARECYEQARTIFEELKETGEVAMTLVNLGRLYVETGEPRRALELHREAVPLIGGDRATEVSNHYGMARALHDLEDFEAARDHLAKTLKTVEELRTETRSEELRMAFFATKQHYYELQIDVLSHLHEARPGDGHDSAAFEVSEQSRARSLLEALGEDAAKVRERPDPELLEKEAALQKELNELEQRRLARESQLAGETDLEEQQRERAFALAMVRGQLRTELTRPRILNVAECQRLLKQGTIVLAYSLGEERSFLWRMTSDDLEWHLLPGRREIEPTVREAHRLLISRNPDDEPERQLYLAKLSEMLLAPVAAELEDQRLIIVAEGALLYLPFAALPRPTRPDEAATHGETPKLDESPDYLIRRHEVVYLPSISVLRRLREQRLTHDPPPLQLAIFADPVFTFGGSSENEGRGDGGDADGDLERALEISPTARLEPLPHTREEAEAILRIARGQTMAAFGFEATKAKVLEGRIEEYRILHFATHGLTNREQPELSGLALSLFNEHGERQDGFLRLHEIYNLTLSAELVVLSACQTGLGREVRGEGFHGLMRGFLYAGAARLVASLWSVADRGTAELMKRFYWNLLEAQAPPALALRAAQLAMLEDPKWKHPFYWAGFIFQGEWWPPDEEPPIGTAVGGAVHEDESDRDYPGPDEEWCDSLPEEWMRELCRLLNRLGEPENE